MFPLKYLCFYIAYFGCVYSRQICYDGYGCFVDTKPFGGTAQRPLAFLPESPEKIGTTFSLYNRNNINSGESISVDQLGSFNASLPTKVYVHGFRHSGEHDYVLDTKDAILKVENVNFIALDWSKGNKFPYTQATANSQVVGVALSLLVNNIISTKKAKAADFHCIGHSLGAHICGYAGQQISGLGRITGLDPAGPYFENTEPIVRLDTTDAQFVDVIHTDGSANLQLGLGLIQNLGHVDFYPNGGIDQPECPTTSGKLLNAIFNSLSFDMDQIEEGVACSHWAAIYYFIDSIENNCLYTAYPCRSNEEFKQGKCMKCYSSNGCNRLGYYARSDRDKGDLYLNTQSPLKEPYCKQNYGLTLVSNTLNEMRQAKGKFTIFFQTKHFISSTELVDDNTVVFKRDSQENFLISLSKRIDLLDEDDEITNVFVSFTKSSSLVTSWLYDSRWSFKSIRLFDGDFQKEFQFCPATAFIETGGQPFLFKKC